MSILSVMLLARSLYKVQLIREQKLNVQKNHSLIITILATGAWVKLAQSDE